MGSLQLPREREESRTTQRFVSGKGLFNQMQQGTLTRTPCAVLCDRASKGHGVSFHQQRKSHRDDCLEADANALHFKVRELEGPLDSLTHTKA